MADLWYSQLAWAAGLFEGEGTFYLLGREHRRPAPQAALQMVDQDIVEHLRSVLGFGSVYEVKRRTASGKTLFHWGTTSYEQAQATAALFWRWLGSRRRAQITRVFKEAVERGKRPLAYCGRGHAYTEENTYWLINPNARGHKRRRRQCRACNALNARRRRQGVLL